MPDVLQVILEKNLTSLPRIHVVHPFAMTRVLGGSLKICAHVLAVAESKGHLEDFLRQYRARKTQPNYTAVVSHGIAKSVGSKPGGKAKRKGPTGKQRP